MEERAGGPGAPPGPAAAASAGQPRGEQAHGPTSAGPTPEVVQQPTQPQARGRRQLYDDYFMMWVWKVEMCKRVDKHERESCPYSHPGELARRRHPSLYQALPCPEARAVGFWSAAQKRIRRCSMLLFGWFLQWCCSDAGVRHLRQCFISCLMPCRLVCCRKRSALGWRTATAVTGVPAACPFGISVHVFVLPGMPVPLMSLSLCCPCHTLLVPCSTFEYWLHPSRCVPGWGWAGAQTATGTVVT